MSDLEHKLPPALRPAFEAPESKSVPPHASPAWSAPATAAPAIAAPAGGAKAATGSPFAGMYDDGHAKPAPLHPYSAPWANIFLSGITDEKSGADSAGQHISGHRNGVAMYEGTGTKGGDPNVRGAEWNSKDPAIAGNAEKRNNQDLLMDMVGVTEFARLGDGVQVDKSGKLIMDHKTLSKPVTTGVPGAPEGEKYLSPEDVGKMGGDQAIKSNPQLAAMMKNGGDPSKDPKLAQQFISLTGHSGGGQSSFYSAIDLYERGFRNISVVGYDMAMSPHQREVLEKLGIPTTNLTGHAGNKEKYVNSPGGEGIRLGMGGDLNYYDASIDRGGNAFDAVAQHDIVSNDKVTTMLRYTTWLDSVGKHQQWNEQNYKDFLKATGGSGNAIADAKGTHAAEDPLGGSFIDHHKRHEDIYLQTPKWTGQDLVNGLHNIPFAGNWLGSKAEEYGNQLTPNFAKTELPRLDVGADINLSRQGNVDLSHGAAQGSVSLQGSSIDVLGAHLTAPESWRASGGVNLSQGAANWNIGGQGGIGADMNLAHGNLDLNVMGRKIDVDQSIRNGLHNAGEGIHNMGRNISHFFGF